MKVGILIELLLEFDKQCEVKVSDAEFVLGLDVIYLKPDEAGYTSKFIVIDDNFEKLK